MKIVRKGILKVRLDFHTLTLFKEGMKSFHFHEENRLNGKILPPEHWQLLSHVGIGQRPMWYEFRKDKKFEENIRDCTQR